ncbi:MAG TPA: hypothetical protein VJT73_03890 [Polyangiaceae bacterium]|nr:hypothetical protein [Polyangiaceae bacterium]
MKANLQLPLLSSDFSPLAKSFDRLAVAAPRGYDEWSTIARGGAFAARARDLAGVQTSCRACHDRYRAQFKAELRSTTIL